MPAERPDRAILTFTLDLNRRGLLPGDTVRYFATARDNTPRGQTGRSREFVLRLPTMSEVRAAQRQATESVASQLDSITDASRRVERQTDDLARERARPAGGLGAKDSESLSYEEAQRAEAVAKSQEELIRRAESLERSLQGLRRSAEAAGVHDTAWQRQLAEIRAQLERALSPELREKLAEPAAGPQGSRCRAGQGCPGAAGRGPEGAARGAGAEPGAVPACRSRRRPGKPEPGIKGAGARAAGLEPAGQLGRQRTLCPRRATACRASRLAGGGVAADGQGRLRRRPAGRDAGSGPARRQSLATDAAGGKVGPARTAPPSQAAGRRGVALARAIE